uniref:Transmembrane protein n=1 Tax=viral metagenome TaxID=1070528 RepID=A0A6C0BYR9_9ZZZZ
MFSFLDDMSLYGDSKEEKPANAVVAEVEVRRVQPDTAQSHVMQAKTQSGQQTARSVETVTPKETLTRVEDSAHCEYGTELHTISEVLQARINQAERRTALMEARILQVFEEYRNKQKPPGGCSWTVVFLIVLAGLFVIWIWSNGKDKPQDATNYPILFSGGAAASPMVVPLSTSSANIPTTFLRQ